MKPDISNSKINWNTPLIRDTLSNSAAPYDHSCSYTQERAQLKVWNWYSLL